MVAGSGTGAVPGPILIVNWTELVTRFPAPFGIIKRERPVIASFGITQVAKSEYC